MVESKATWVKLDFTNHAKQVHLKPEETNDGRTVESAGVHMSMHEVGTGKIINVYFTIEDWAKVMLQGRSSFKHAFDGASETEQAAVRHFIRHEDSLEKFAPVRGVLASEALGIKL